MKPIKILSTALILAGFATSATATDGNQQSAEAEATAVVLAELTLEKTEDINWGQVARGDNPILDPVTGEATGGAGINNSTTSIGKFELSGEGGANIHVSWEKEDLSGPGNDIEFTPAVSFGTGPGPNAPHGGSIISDGDTKSINDHPSAGAPPIANNYFWVGGSIAVDADQQAGEYEGEFTLIVEYH